MSEESTSARHQKTEIFLKIWREQRSLHTNRALFVGKPPTSPAKCPVPVGRSPFSDNSPCACEIQIYLPFLITERILPATSGAWPPRARPSLPDTGYVPDPLAPGDLSNMRIRCLARPATLQDRMYNKDACARCAVRKDRTLSSMRASLDVATMVLLCVQRKMMPSSTPREVMNPSGEG
jgi:hypothetical protein